jgi:hypothetical protein
MASSNSNLFYTLPHRYSGRASFQEDSDYERIMGGFDGEETIQRGYDHLSSCKSLSTAPKDSPSLPLHYLAILITIFHAFVEISSMEVLRFVVSSSHRLAESVTYLDSYSLSL